MLSEGNTIIFDMIQKHNGNVITQEEWSLAFDALGISEQDPRQIVQADLRDIQQCLQFVSALKVERIDARLRELRHEWSSWQGGLVKDASVEVLMDCECETLRLGNLEADQH